MGLPAAAAEVKERVNLALHKGHSVCLVLDYGSQYTQLIARRIRENGVYSMLMPGDATLVTAEQPLRDLILLVMSSRLSRCASCPDENCPTFICQMALGSRLFNNRFLRSTKSCKFMQDRIKNVNPKAIILSGGPNSVHVQGAPQVPSGFFEYCNKSGIPVLGICYGMQLIVQASAKIIASG